MTPIETTNTDSVVLMFRLFQYFVFRHSKFGSLSPPETWIRKVRSQGSCFCKHNQLYCGDLCGTDCVLVLWGTQPGGQGGTSARHISFILIIFTYVRTCENSLKSLWYRTKQRLIKAEGCILTFKYLHCFQNWNI